MAQTNTESAPFHERQHAQNKFRGTYSDSQYHHSRFRGAPEIGFHKHSCLLHERG